MSSAPMPPSTPQFPNTAHAGGLGGSPGRRNLSDHTTVPAASLPTPLAFFQILDLRSSLALPPRHMPLQVQVLCPEYSYTTFLPIVLNPWSTLKCQLKCPFFREAFPDSPN